MAASRFRGDPRLRADRFIERWQALEAGGGGRSRADTARTEMIDGLCHDPALRDELMRRAPELDHGRAPTIEQTMEQVRQRQIEMDRKCDRQQDCGFER